MGKFFEKLKAASAALVHSFAQQTQPALLEKSKIRQVAI